jgi:hypothetical protein
MSQTRVVLALVLSIGGVTGLAFAAGPDWMAARLGLLMAVIGGWFLCTAWRFARRRSLARPDRSVDAKKGPAGQSSVGLLLAGLLIAVGAIGALTRAGSRTSVELGLELLSLTIGLALFIGDLRGAGPLSEDQA